MHSLLTFVLIMFLHTLKSSRYWILVFAFVFALQRAKRAEKVQGQENQFWKIASSLTVFYVMRPPYLEALGFVRPLYP